MTIRAILWTYKPRQDGQCNVKVYVHTEGGQKKYFKTDIHVDRELVLPVKPAAWAVLQKRNFNLSGDTNQEANRKLKTIAAMAGLNEMVSEGKKTGPKWSFVTTHTARRSAATNLYLQGVSLKMIADLGGWGDEGTLRVYLRASGLDTALVAKDLGFFR